MKGRILMMKVMPFFAILQQQKVLSVEAIKGLTSNYLKQQELSSQDIILDLYGYEIPEEKMATFSYVIQGIESLENQGGNAQ